MLFNDNPYLREWLPFVHVHGENTAREERICNNPPYMLPPCPVLNLTEQPTYLARSVTITPSPARKRTFSNAIVFGCSDIIQQGGRLLYLNEPEPGRYQMGDEFTGFLKLDLPRASLVSTIYPSAMLEHALLFCGSTTYNYAHWLTEYLPKFLLLDEYDRQMRPIIIDDTLPLAMYESILHLLKRPHYVIRLHRYQSMRVKHLLTVQTGTSVPFGYREAHQPEIIADEIRFSSTGIALLRGRCFERIMDGKIKSPYRKLFVMRRSSGRHLLNSDAVAKLAAHYGYETVEPEKFSFAEQVRLFASATHVLGQTGAGISNILFAPAGCRILLLGTNFEQANYRYFHSLAHLCGHDFAYFACHASNPVKAHANLTCDLNRLEEQLSSQS